MNRTIIFWAFVASSLVYLNIVGAACNDCILEIKPSYVSVCRGEQASINLEVTNIYAYSRSISLSALSEVPITSTMPSQVVVEAYKKKTVPVGLIYPSNIPFGSYRFTITASGYGSSDSDDGLMEIRNCHASSLGIIPQVGLCEGETKRIEATLTNLGSKPDTYSLSFENLPPKVQISLTPGSVSLQPGESRRVDITITSLGLHFGSFTSKLVASSANDYTEGLVRIDLNKCHSVDVISPENALTCSGYGSKPSYTALVRNNGNLADDFDLHLSGNCKASLPFNSIHLGPGESKEVEVRITSGLGLCDSIITAEGTYSRDSSTTLVDIRECYGVELEIIPAQHTICKCEPFDGFKVRIKNTGINRQTFILTAEGIPGGLDRTKVTLEPGSEDLLFFKQNLNTCCIEDEEELVIQATSTQNTAIARAKLGLITSDELCAGMGMKLAINPRVFDCSGGEIPLLLLNTGYSDLRVRLTAEGPGNFDIQPKEVTLKPFESRPIAMYFFISPDAEGNHKFRIIATSQYQTEVLDLDLDVSYPICKLSGKPTLTPEVPVVPWQPPESRGGERTPTGEAPAGGPGLVMDYTPLILVLVVVIAILSILLILRFLCKK